MELVDWLTGIGAVIAAAGGIILVVRELHRRERRSADEQIDQLVQQVFLLRGDLIAYQSWAFGLATDLADCGGRVPPAPDLHRLAEQVDQEDQQHRRLRRRWKAIGGSEE